MRFRLEANACTREKVSTSSVGETGLEGPETYFVELEFYEQRYGKAKPEDIVFDEPEPGAGLKAGVSYLRSIKNLMFLIFYILNLMFLFFRLEFRTFELSGY